MQSCFCMRRQQWALIRRFGIITLRTPITSTIRLIVWPGFILWLAVFVLNRSLTPDEQVDLKNYYINFITGTFMMLTIFFIYWFADLMIKDKANEMKKLMLSMGLRRLDYYCAHSICLQLYVFPISLAVAIGVKIFLLDDTVSWPVILLLHILTSLHLDSATSFLVSFITSPIFSALFPVLIFFEPLVASLTDYCLKHSNEVFKPSLLVLSAISPYQPARLFYNNYLNGHSDQPQQRTNVASDWPLVFVAQAVWIIVLRLFACWFEEVCPWQKVSAVMSPWFCLKKNEDRYENSMESTATTSQYFERRAHDGEVGIKISSVTKVFKNIPALSDVSFSIFKGETTLLLGHNGAGKTTLMNIILGLLNPDGGYVKIKKRLGGVASVGVCPQSSILDDSLTVRQHLQLFCDIKSNMSGHERDRHVLQTIEDVSLASHANKQPGELSGGMKRKLSLGIAFVGKSDVLILDEPSSGLDPDSRMFVWNAIRRYRADRTVLLSTQHMEEADYLGDRIAIMSAGQIVCCGSSVYLNKLFGTGYKLRIECKPSKRKGILDHIRGYFGDAQTEESQGTTERPSISETNADFVVELKMKNKDDDAELQLIKLLQDIESNSSTLGIHSYGLKSSSIEDVMLNSSKYFSTPQADKAKTGPTVGHSDLSKKIVKRDLTRSELIRALCIKQLQVYLVHWKLVILLKILLPIFCTYYVLVDANIATSPWHSPVVVLMVGHFVYFPTKEQVSKFKIMQLQSRASVWLYWLSQIIVDLLAVIICIISINIFVAIVLKGAFLAPDWQVHLLVSLATFLFCLAAMFSCYALSTLLGSADASYGIVVLFYALSTIISIPFRFLALVVGAEIRNVINIILDHLFLPFLPGDAFNYLLSGLASSCYLRNTFVQCVPETGISRVGLGVFALIFHILLYSALLYFIELQKIDIAWYMRIRNLICCLAKRSPPDTMLGDRDNDVLKENEKALIAIKDPTNTGNGLIAAQLNKSYYRNTPVIKDLSFTVKKGECFGLLGVNGAGKSTTFSMLAAETPVDSGRILVNGFYLNQNLTKYRSMIGYDPQSNPAVSLTVYQSLSLMASLRGLDQSCQPALIKSITDLLEMSHHAHKLESELSGGTKRKLALGMALIGDPTILMLDEPTAGVDPFSRRGVWRLLKSVRTRGNVSVVISSHAMEECEAICDRISIMARGRLRCIGTFLHLRSKFAKGCSLKVQFSSVLNEHTSLDRNLETLPLTTNPGDSVAMHRKPARPINTAAMHRKPARPLNTAELENFVDSSIPELQQLLDSSIGPDSYKVADKNANSLTFEITDNQVKRSMLFKTMREFRQKHHNVSYMINDSSLEDIFITLAREQQEH